MINQQIVRATRGKEYITGWTKESEVHLTYRDSAGKLCQQTFTPDWYFYVERENYESRRTTMLELRRHGLITHVAAHELNPRFLKVYCQNKNLYKSQIDSGVLDPKSIVLDTFREKGIRTFEGDLSSLKRMMIDYGLNISQRYKVIFIDIETQDQLEDGTRLPINVGAYPILSFSVTLSNGKTLFFTHQSEEFLLGEMEKYLRACDIFVTYNGNGFDLPYIKARFERYGIFFPWKSKIHVDFFERIYDLYKFDTGWTKFTLDAVTQKICPDAPKFDRGQRTIYSMWLEYMQGRNTDLRDYNNSDTFALKRINDEEQIIPFMIQVARNCKSFLNHFHKSWLIDTFILNQGHILGRPLPTRDPHKKKTKKFEGAYVIEPKAGRYSGVSVFDFASLYPNVIRTWNIGTEDDTMLTGEQLQVQDWSEIGTKGATPNDDVYFAVDKESMLALAVRMFLDGRKEARALLKTIDKSDHLYITYDSQQKAWKILANTTYGILGSDKTRYFDVRIAESITHGGRVCLNMAIEWFTKNGFTVLYGDTDSVFVQMHGTDPKSVLPKLHADMHRWLRERWGCRNPTIELEYEKTYKRIVLCGKKHYYGILENDTMVSLDGEDAEEETNGMGYDHKKRDTVDIAKKLLESMLMDLLKNSHDHTHYEDWIRKIRKKILLGNIPLGQMGMFTKKKMVRKEPSEYDQSKALPLHVQIWQEMKDAGQEVWVPFMVEYLITPYDAQTSTKQGKRDGVALSMFKGSGKEIDRHHYWNTEILAKLIRVLVPVFPEVDWQRFNTHTAAKRKKFFIEKLELLKKKEAQPVRWWATIHKLRSSILSNEQATKLYRKAGVTESRMLEMRESLDAWLRKRLINYIGTTTVTETCDVCKVQGPHSKGLRHTKKFNYTSLLCSNCGKETDLEKKEKA